MRIGAPSTLALLLVVQSCTAAVDSAAPGALTPAREPAVATAEPALGWPYWREISPGHAFAEAARTMPLRADLLVLTPGARARWDAAGPAAREQVLAQGFAPLSAAPRTYSVGEFYESLLCADVPALVTVDALAAVSFLSVEAAMAEAEDGLAGAALTLLRRLDLRLGAAEPGAQPDLVAGLHVARAVVAVGLALSDEGYVAPKELEGPVRAELALVRAHAGPSESPTLGETIDYAAFTPQGAARQNGPGRQLAAEWLAHAALAFDAGEGGARVDMSAARARTRAALLIARLVMDGPDADGRARDASFRLERLARLAFGDPAGTAPVDLVRFSAKSGFDLHDARAIAGATSLDRFRRAAAPALGAMELSPLGRAPEEAAWDEPARRGEPRRGVDVGRWLASDGWSQRPSRHVSFYASALDALATWTTPSSGDERPGGASRERLLAGSVAAWTLLRHGAVPYGRVRARRPTGQAPPSCVRPTSVVLVERRPRTLAALLGYVSQVTSGLEAQGLLPDASPARGSLREAQGILALALSAAGGDASLGPSSELQSLPSRLAFVESEVAPAAGPVAALVFVDGSHGKALQEGVAGVEPELAVVTDPRTARPWLAVGARLTHYERWVDSRVSATDRDFEASLPGLGAVGDVAESAADRR